MKDKSDKADLNLNIQKTKIMASSSIMHVCMLSHFSHVWLFLTLRTVTHQALLSMGFSRQKYWNVLPLSPPEGLLNSGIKPGEWGPLGLSINSAVDSQGQKLMESSGYSVPWKFSWMRSEQHNFMATIAHPFLCVNPFLHQFSGATSWFPEGKFR